MRESSRRIREVEMGYLGTEMEMNIEESGWRARKRGWESMFFVVLVRNWSGNSKMVNLLREDGILIKSCFLRENLKIINLLVKENGLTLIITKLKLCIIISKQRKKKMRKKRQKLMKNFMKKFYKKKKKGKMRKKKRNKKRKNKKKRKKKMKNQNLN